MRGYTRRQIELFYREARRGAARERADRIEDVMLSRSKNGTKVIQQLRRK